MEFCSSTVF